VLRAELPCSCLPQTVGPPTVLEPERARGAPLSPPPSSFPPALCRWQHCSPSPSRCTRVGQIRILCCIYTVCTPYIYGQSNRKYGGLNLPHTDLANPTQHPWWGMRPTFAQAIKILPRNPGPRRWRCWQPPSAWAAASRAAASLPARPGEPRGMCVCGGGGVQRGAHSYAFFFFPFCHMSCHGSTSHTLTRKPMLPLTTSRAPSRKQALTASGCPFVGCSEPPCACASHAPTGHSPPGLARSVHDTPIPPYFLLEFPMGTTACTAYAQHSYSFIYEFGQPYSPQMAGRRMRLGAGRLRWT